MYCGKSYQCAVVVYLRTLHKNILETPHSNILETSIMTLSQRLVSCSLPSYPYHSFRPHKQWVRSLFRLVVSSRTFVQTNSVWALGAKFGFSNVGQPKGILATRVDLISTIVLYVLQGFLQVIIWGSQYCVYDWFCVSIFFVILNCYLIVHVCVNVHLSMFPH
jgi:hypothetical protein